jgi:C-terminal processing protease CtpA/Prc
MLVKDVSPEGPSAGLLQPGDEIVHVSDAGRSWSSYSELKSMSWGQGKQGTRLTVTVRRGGQLVEIPITRGLVKERTVPMSMLLDGWRQFLLKDMPDYRSDIRLIIEDGDLVGCYTIDTGTSRDYQQTAVWPTAFFARLKDGKIVETWGWRIC